MNMDLSQILLCHLIIMWFAANFLNSILDVTIISASSVFLRMGEEDTWVERILPLWNGRQPWPSPGLSCWNNLSHPGQPHTHGVSAALAASTTVPCTPAFWHFHSRITCSISLPLLKTIHPHCPFNSQYFPSLILNSGPSNASTYMAPPLRACQTQWY